MIGIHIPTSLEYDTSNAGLLATELKNLRDFDEIALWRRKAEAEVKTLHSIVKAIEDKRQTAFQAISHEEQEHAAKSFLPKLFDGRKEQKRWLGEQSRLDREKTQIEVVIDQFESAIDFVPDSLDDLEKILEECKQQKKELSTEKKAVNAQISSIRVEARQQTANTNYGKYGKGDRHLIKLNKEAALKPQDSQKTALERQITKLDEMIAWLGRFV